MSQDSGSGESSAKRGRPTKFNESLKEKILQLAEQGKTEEQIAEIIGVSAKTLSNWKGAHSDFLQAIKESKQTADELVEASLYHKAIGYKHKAVKVFCQEGQIIEHEYVEEYAPDTTAGIFWLKNRKPSEWRDKTEIEHSGSLKEMSDEELERRLQEKLTLLGGKNE